MGGGLSNGVQFLGVNMVSLLYKGFVLQKEMAPVNHKLRASYYSGVDKLILLRYIHQT